MGFIGAAVGIMIGIVIFGHITPAFDCAQLGPQSGDSAESNKSSIQATSSCNSAKNIAWTVMGIIPITLFFALFNVFGQIGQR